MAAGGEADGGGAKDGVYGRLATRHARRLYTVRRERDLQTGHSECTPNDEVPAASPLDPSVLYRAARSMGLNTDDTAIREGPLQS